MISPHVLRAIGTREARRWCLTGEVMDAATARRVGLAHEVADDAALGEAAEAILAALLAGAPGAQAEIKRLLRHVTGRSDAGDAALLADTARWIARVRAGGEAREGLSAFLERRRPGWIRDA
jgi:methylglutaconyl-CoA hydratase